MSIDEGAAHIAEAVILHPGDTLVVRLARRHPAEDIAEMRDAFERHLPDVKVCLLDADVEFAVQRTELDVADLARKLQDYARHNGGLKL